MASAKVNDININYKVQGHGPPLVLIMGLGGECGDWVLQTRVFKRYFRVVTFDNRGVGKTDKPNEPYSIKTMADDVIGLMDYLDIRCSNVLGVSMGGMIAQEIAINYPERVNKLILVCTTPGKDEKGGHSPEILRGMGLKEHFTDEDIEQVDMGKVMSSLNSFSFGDSMLKMIAVPFCWVRMKLFGIDGLRGQFEASMKHSTLSMLDKIKAPTLVIAGAKDRIVPPRFAEVLAQRIPNARLVMIEDGSHTLIAEKRSRFNREVLDFLQAKKSV
jgi:pimeloyl-ACP methyl ester carboxylesterase